MKYRSKFEQRVAKELEDNDVSFTYETYSYEYDEPLRKNRVRCLACNGTALIRTGWYTPDFFLRGGTIIEAKGRFTAANRRMMVAMKKDHPELNLVLLFMADNRLHKNSSTFYSDWAMENDYDFAIGSPKRSWYNEQ